MSGLRRTDRAAWLVAALVLASFMSTQAHSDDEVRPRLRELGAHPGVLEPGPLNAITDVAGVRVGHTTLIRGDDIRTGVTAILPHGGDLFADKVPAAAHVGNGYGKAAGLLQVIELGEIETPIVLTNTLSVAPAVQALVEWTLAQPGHEHIRSVNAVVGETNDGRLNDIRGRHVTRADVIAAIESAAAGPVPEGSVGAGTGTVAFGWKGGIGTASRRLSERFGGYTVGALVQSNYGGVLTIDGVPVGEALGRLPLAAAGESPVEDRQGSCMIVIATDAPVLSRNLERMARRAVLGLARTGSYMENGSGDFVIAFSTANRISGDARVRRVEALANAAMNPLFLAVVESVEEAVYNSLTRASSMTGHGGQRVEALPIDRLRELLERHGRLPAD